MCYYGELWFQAKRVVGRKDSSVHPGHAARCAVGSAVERPSRASSASAEASFSEAETLSTSKRSCRFYGYLLLRWKWQSDPSHPVSRTGLAFGRTLDFARGSQSSARRVPLATSSPFTRSPRSGDRRRQAHPTRPATAPGSCPEYAAIRWATPDSGLERRRSRNETVLSLLRGVAPGSEPP